MDSNAQPEQKLSKYNSAVSQLYRLDSLRQSAHLHSRSGKLINWNWDLDSTWRELAGDADGKDVKNFYKLNQLIGKNKNNRKILYFLLERKEIFLAKLQNKQGKGTAYIDPDEDDLEE